MPVDVLAERFAQPFLSWVPEDRLVQYPAGFFRHSKSAGVDLGIDFFRGMSHEGQFEIMNNARPVHGHGGDDPSLHEVHHNRAQSDLDHMGAESDDDRPSFSMGLHDGLATACNVLTPRISGSER